MLDDDLLDEISRDGDAARAVANWRTAVVIPSLLAVRPEPDDEARAARPAPQHAEAREEPFGLRPWTSR